jgi:hypothetical protein
MNGLIVHFPWLHPKLARGPLPEGIVFFDPGLAVDGDGRRWRSPDLPCDNREVRALLHDYLQFAERFPRSSDMRAYHAAGLDNFFTDTTMDIRSQLTGGPAAAEPEPSDLRRKAQILLAMTLFREDQYVGICEQEGRFENARDGLQQILGVDDEETFAEPGGADPTLFPRAAAELPWRDVLMSLLPFLPADVMLFVSDGDVLRELRSLGLEFGPCPDKAGELICSQLGADEAERICGVRPDIDSPLTIAAYPLNHSTSENDV